MYSQRLRLSRLRSHLSNRQPTYLPASPFTVQIDKHGRKSVRTFRVSHTLYLTQPKPEHEGLSKMKRNHIHLAQGLPGTGVLSGMRQSSSVFIYVDVEKALQAGLNFYLSSNGVVLSEGDSRGFINPRFFQRVTDAKGNALPDWQPSMEETPALTADAPPPSEDKVVELAGKTESLSL